MIQSACFYILSAVILFSAVMVVTQRNLFTCALFLAAALSSIAGFFVLLGADFLAAMQILLYVGGILVIIVFAVMLSSVQQSKMQAQLNTQWFSSFFICAGVLTVILAGLNREFFSGQEAQFSPTTDPIGKLLFGGMVLPFEVISLVLLASLVGAVIFSKRERDLDSSGRFQGPPQ